MIKKILFSLLFLTTISSPLACASSANAEGLPENAEESKALLEKGINTAISELPKNLINIFKNEALPVWKKMHEWFYSHWGYKIIGWFKQTVEPELEKRKPGIKEEFEKEKKEMKEEAPQVGKSLWEKFLEIIR